MAYFHRTTERASTERIGIYSHVGLLLVTFNRESFSNAPSSTPPSSSDSANGPEYAETKQVTTAQFDRLTHRYHAVETRNGSFRSKLRTGERPKQKKETIHLLTEDLPKIQNQGPHLSLKMPASALGKKSTHLRPPPRTPLRSPTEYRGLQASARVSAQSARANEVREP